MGACVCHPGAPLQDLWVPLRGTGPRGRVVRRPWPPPRPCGSASRSACRRTPRCRPRWLPVEGSARSGSRIARSHGFARPGSAAGSRALGLATCPCGSVALCLIIRLCRSALLAHGSRAEQSASLKLGSSRGMWNAKWAGSQEALQPWTCLVPASHRIASARRALAPQLESSLRCSAFADVVGMGGVALVKCCIARLYW